MIVTLLYDNVSALSCQFAVNTLANKGIYFFYFVEFQIKGNKSSIAKEVQMKVVHKMLYHNPQIPKSLARDTP